MFKTKVNQGTTQPAVRIAAAGETPTPPRVTESKPREAPAMPGILRRERGAPGSTTHAPAQTTSGKTPHPLRKKTSTVSFKDVPKPGGPKKAKSMNSLRSGPKIGSAVDLGLSVHALHHEELQHLARGLGGKGSQDSMPSPADQESVRLTLANFADELSNGLANYDNRADNRFLVNAEYSRRLTHAEATELGALMKKTHMVVSSRPEVDEATGAWSDKVRIYFGGTQNVRDGWHDVRSGLGMVGGHDRSAKRIAELMAKVLSPAGFAELEFLGGLSMGGGLAQVFLLALESRIELPSRPAVVLLDPLLLNDREAQHAIKGGTRPVDFSKPRAIAVTLDHPEAPRKGLVSRLKTFGRRRSPGLVRLKLALDDSAFPEGQAPKPMWLLGYHGKPAYYGSALARFAAVKPDDTPPVPILPPGVGRSASPAPMESDDEISPAPRTDSDRTGSTAFGGSTTTGRSRTTRRTTDPTTVSTPSRTNTAKLAQLTGATPAEMAAVVRPGLGGALKTLAPVGETGDGSPSATSHSTDTAPTAAAIPVPDGLGAALMRDIFESRQEVGAKLEILGGRRSEGVLDHHATLAPDFLGELGADIPMPKGGDPLPVPKRTVAQRLLRRPARPAAATAPTPRPVLPVPDGVTVPAEAEPVAVAGPESDEVILARWGLASPSRG